MKNCMAITIIVSTNILGTSSRLSTFHHSRSDSCLVVPYVTFGTFCPLPPTHISGILQMQWTSKESTVRVYDGIMSRLESLDFQT